MRDGNSTSSPLNADNAVGFQPTYEGWKLDFPASMAVGLDCFQPTYEGWKLGKEWGIGMT